MRKVIMTREKILESKEYLIDPETLKTGKEVWHNKDCEPFWNEYYRVDIFDNEQYDDEYQALCENSSDFHNLDQAKAYYEELQAQLAKEGLGKNVNEFMVGLYDLLAKNTEYKPREKLDEMIASDVEDYHLNSDENGCRIVLYGKDGGEYHITMNKVSQDTPTGGR